MKRREEKLPAPLMTAVEAGALAFARQRIAELRDGFDPGAGRRLAFNLLTPWALAHPDNMSRLKALARAGSAEAHGVLDELIKQFGTRTGKLPPQLMDYVTDGYANPARTRGRKRSSDVVRNIVFVGIVVELVHRFGLRPTRSRQAAPTRIRQAHSAASILAIALQEELPDGFHKAKAAERAIEPVWLLFGPIVAGWAERSVTRPGITISNT